MTSTPAAATDALPWWTPLVTLATPGLGFLGVYVASKITSKSSARDSKVSQTEADTNQFSALTEGFVEQLRVLREDVKDQREQVEKVTARMEAMEAREQEYLAHISLLEGMVPNPPGPPVRPWIVALAAAHQ